MAPRSTETELKLALPDEAAWERLCRALDPPRSEQLQRNLFLDTAAGALRKAGLALRLREQSGAVWLTVKGPSESLGNAVRRTELEARVPDSEAAAIWKQPARLVELELAPLEQVRPQLDAALQPLCHFLNLRRSYPRQLAGAERLLEVDRSHFGGGRVDHELEIELGDTAEADDADALAEAIEILLGGLAIPYRVQPLSKLARALQRQR